MTDEETVPISVLDFVGIEYGETAHDSLLGAIGIAQAVERSRLPPLLGLRAPQHAQPGLHRARDPHRRGRRADRAIRVGAAGIMLPNHASFKVAENFRTLMAMHPGRIDLGLGRAPGTDPLTAHVLRRGIDIDPAAEFPEQVAELLAFLGDGAIRAGPSVPAAGRGAGGRRGARDCSCSAPAATARSSPRSTG